MQGGEREQGGSSAEDPGSPNVDQSQQPRTSFQPVDQEPQQTQHACKRGVVRALSESYCLPLVAPQQPVTTECKAEPSVQEDSVSGAIVDDDWDASLPRRQSNDHPTDKTQETLTLATVAEVASDQGTTFSFTNFNSHRPKHSRWQHSFWEM